MCHRREEKRREENRREEKIKEDCGLLASLTHTHKARARTCVRAKARTKTKKWIDLFIKNPNRVMNFCWKKKKEKVPPKRKKGWDCILCR
jgi:hypothetical protein